MGYYFRHEPLNSKPLSHRPQNNEIRNHSSSRSRQEGSNSRAFAVLFQYLKLHGCKRKGKLTTTSRTEWHRTAPFTIPYIISLSKWHQITRRIDEEGRARPLKVDDTVSRSRLLLYETLRVNYIIHTYIYMCIIWFMSRVAYGWISTWKTGSIFINLIYDGNQ